MVYPQKWAILTASLCGNGHVRWCLLIRLCPCHIRELENCSALVAMASPGNSRSMQHYTWHCLQHSTLSTTKVISH